MREAAYIAALLVLFATPVPAELRDPTRPPGPAAAPGDGPEAAPTPPRLTSILVSPGRRLAVVDGRSVRVGDALGDARVLTIEADAVRLRRGDETITLRLAGAPVKQRSGEHSGEGR